MQGQKILVTGLTGQVARPIALHLAPRNEVWGIARFSKPELRDQLEAGGVRCETVDLEAGDFSALPTDTMSAGRKESPKGTLTFSQLAPLHSTNLRNVHSRWS